MTRDSTHPDDGAPAPHPLPKPVPSTPTPTTTSDFAEPPGRDATPFGSLWHPPAAPRPAGAAPRLSGPPAWPPANRPAGSLPSDWVRDGRLPNPLRVPPQPDPAPAAPTPPEDEASTAVSPAVRDQPAADDPSPGHAVGEPPPGRAAEEPPAGRESGAGAGGGAARPAWRRPGALVAALLVLVVLLAGGAVAVLRPGPVQGWLAGPKKPSVAPSRSPEVTPSPVLDPASGAPVPVPAAVARLVAPLLRSGDLGTGVGASVLDAATGQPLYDAAASTPEVPASVAKLATATAVLAVRGPGYRIPTKVVAGPAPGEVVLVGGGDPSLAVNARGAYPGAARLDQLAAQVKTALGATKPTKVLVDSSLFGGPGTGPGWDPDIVSGGYGAPVTALMVDGGRTVPTPDVTAPRSTQPDLDAGQRFARLLGLPATAVARGTAATTAKQLGGVESPPLVDLIEPMLQHSDNMLAEVLLRQVALAKGQPATFAGTSAAERDVLAALGLPVGDTHLVDGSGLSRQDRVSPRFLTGVLALVAGGRQPNLWPVSTGLPVAAWSGTLASRYGGTEAPADGLVRAKTGSLTGTDTLAGMVMDKDGRLLVFAMMAEGVGDGYAADAAMDGVAAALAGCGCH